MTCDPLLGSGGGQASASAAVFRLAHGVVELLDAAQPRSRWLHTHMKTSTGHAETQNLGEIQVWLRQGPDGDGEREREIHARLHSVKMYG